MLKMFKMCESLTRFIIQLLKEPASCLKHIQTKLRQNVRNFTGFEYSEHLYLCSRAPPSDVIVCTANTPGCIGS